MKIVGGCLTADGCSRATTVLMYDDAAKSVHAVRNPKVVVDIQPQFIVFQTGGVMNLIWVAVIATFVLLEKVVPKGEIVGRVGGVLLIAFAGYVAFFP